jgi:prepilin peptidase CpaA
MIDPGFLAELPAALCRASLFVLLGLAAAHDVADFRIPNAMPALLLAAFGLFSLAAPGEAAFLDGMLGGGVTLALGFALFSARLMGGGDVKLLAAAALWTGFRALPAHLLAVAVAGAGLALVLVVLRWAAGRAVLFVPGWGPAAPLPKVLRPGEPLPYGVAIAIGTVLVIPA